MTRAKRALKVSGAKKAAPKVLPPSPLAIAPDPALSI
jgi:hypothetical protein